jgi:hypothetical protein
MNAGLRPWASAPWRRRRHDGATNSTNAVINSGCVSFDFIIARQVEPLYHPLNVSLSKKRTNIGLKACGIVPPFVTKGQISRADPQARSIHSSVIYQEGDSEDVEPHESWDQAATAPFGDANVMSRLASLKS